MIKAVVTDIEGTTSSLSFVKDILFPYARQNLPDFVRKNFSDSEVAGLLDDARREVGINMDIEQLIAQFVAWIDQDKKITSLKSLQGLIWKDGYLQGAYRGHIYADVALRLKTLHEQGCKLYIYSSGSVFAQKLLFANSEFGDLTNLFSGYFDTHIGGKKDSASYRKIAEQIAMNPNEILFLSDIKEELDAAKAAGFATFWLVRGASIDTRAEHKQIASFDGIEF